MQLTENSINDVRVSINLKNNKLLTAMESKGYYSIKKFADDAGVSYHFMLGLVKMTYTPIDTNGDYKESIFKMCEILQKMPDDLFSERQKYQPLENNQFIFDVDSAQPAYAQIESREFSHSVEKMLDILPPFQKELVKSYFGFDTIPINMSQISKDKKITPARVKQIMDKALRKLRHPLSVALIESPI